MTRQQAQPSLLFGEGENEGHPGSSSAISGVVKPRTFDYRKGKAMWGHTLHASSWSAVPGRSVTSGLLWWKKTTTTPDRASVMIHATPDPRAGDRFLMSGKSGVDWDLRIVGVEPCGNPRDMFTVTLEDDATRTPPTASDKVPGKPQDPDIEGPNP